MNSQERFWREIYQLKAHACYLELYLGKSESIDRAINFVIALTSTSSLGIWAFLKKFDEIWAGVIVLSQIIAVAKGFLPYRARVKALASSVHEYEELMIWAEGKWFEVADGRLTEAEIAGVRSDLQKRSLKTMKVHFPTSTLPENRALLDKAEIRANTYFANFYGSTTNEQTDSTDP